MTLRPTIVSSKTRTLVYRKPCRIGHLHSSRTLCMVMLYSSAGERQLLLTPCESWPGRLITTHDLRPRSISRQKMIIVGNRKRRGWLDSTKGIRKREREKRSKDGYRPNGHFDVSAAPISVRSAADTAGSESYLNALIERLATQKPN